MSTANIINVLWLGCHMLTQPIEIDEQLQFSQVCFYILTKKQQKSLYIYFLYIYILYKINN